MILKNIIRYFWVGNLVLLFLSAYFLAGLINFNLSKKFEPAMVPPNPSSEKSIPSARFNYSPSSSRIIERNLFGTIDLSLTQAENLGEPVVARVNATLNGIIYFCDGCSINRAFITLMDQNTKDAYKIGDELPGGAKVENILEKQVILSLGGGSKQELILEEIAPGPPKKGPEYISPYALMSPEESARKLAERRKGLGFDDRIQRLSETYYKIQRSAISDALGNINDLLTQARTVPNFVEDASGRRMDGFRLMNVQPGSIWEKLGIRSGDIVKKINGVPMDNVEKGFELMQQLRFEKRFEIELFRGARPLLVNYEIIE